MRARPFRRCLPAVLALAGALVAAPGARAQTTDKNDKTDKAGAVLLFDQGRKLMEAKRFPEACEKFAASQKLDPAVGTVLNLGECQEQSGHLATAWGYYREALALAESRSDAERGRFASERAKSLEGHLATLTLAPPSPAIAGLEVRRDGVVVGAAALGMALPIDTGMHTVEATAPGRRPWSAQVEVLRDGTAVSVKVPPLESDPGTTPTTLPATPVDDSRHTERNDAHEMSPPPPPQPSPSEPLGATRWAAIATGGAGVVALGASGFFALRASSTWNGANGHCNANNQCDDVGYEANQTARRQAGVATAFAVTGVVAIAAAGTLWLLAPSHGRAGLAVTWRGGPSQGAVGLSGAF
jgi:hypothetical protein